MKNNIFTFFCLTLITALIAPRSISHASDLNYNDLGLSSTRSTLTNEESEVDIRKDRRHRYIKSNGIPNHSAGPFPNSKTPYAIDAHSYAFRMTLTPERGYAPTPKDGIVGIAVNGIPFKPTIEKFWNDDADSGWRYEAINPTIDFELDKNNAYVDPSGRYNYHGIPTAIVHNQLKLIGYAADGFPILAARTSPYKSGYQLKKGTRPAGAPEGNFDGTFAQDYEYVAGSGDLDACNGIVLHGQYTYVLTREFPQMPRCLFGTADPSFERSYR